MLDCLERPLLRELANCDLSLSLKDKYKELNVMLAQTQKSIYSLIIPSPVIQDRPFCSRPPASLVRTLAASPTSPTHPHCVTGEIFAHKTVCKPSLFLVLPVTVAWKYALHLLLLIPCISKCVSCYLQHQEMCAHLCCASSSVSALAFSSSREADSLAFSCLREAVCFSR